METCNRRAVCGKTARAVRREGRRRAFPTPIQGGEFDKELGDGARGVKLAEGAGALQFAQKAFVDLPEYLLVFAAVEVDLVEFVDDLAQVDARFHVVVVIGEDFAHEQGALIAAGEVDIGEGGEEPLIDKFYELIAGDAFVVARPLVPVQLGGDG